jgi:membrane protein implicated in regulation of membrane protease activity
VTIIQFLTAGANAPFTIAAGVTLLFALVQWSGILGVLGSDHEADHDQDHEEDAPSREIGSIVMASLGFGRIPFSLIWQAFGLAFALTGLSENGRWIAKGAVPLWSLAWTVPTSLLAGWLVVAALAYLLGPIFATKEQEATSRAELVGSLGVVISTRVTADFGEVRIKDKSGHDLRVVCKLASGSRGPSEHERVVVVDYDTDAGTLLVAPLEDELLEETPHSTTTRFNHLKEG